MANRYIKLNVPTTVSGNADAGAFEITADGLEATQKRFRRGDTDPTAYIAPNGQGSFYAPIGNAEKTVVIEAEDGLGNAIRKLVTLQGSTALTPPRIDPITTKIDGRTAPVPTAWYDYVADESVDPLTHAVSDPLLGTCSIYTHKAVKDGNWSDPTVWDTGTTPHALTDGTASVCTAAFDIVYDVLSDIRIKDIHVNHEGSLSFATTRTRLWVDTIMVDGILKIGDVNVPIPDSGIVTSGVRIPQCEIVFWASEAPGVTTRLGLATMGPVRIHGEEKADRVALSASIFAGATTVTIPNFASTGWKVGDELLFVGTEYVARSATDPTYAGPTSFYGPWQGADTVMTREVGYSNSSDDVRRIASVAGDVVTLSSALTFDHILYTRTLARGQVVTVPPYVCNMSRSIRFRSADSGDTAIWAGADITDLQKRAHIMYMHSDDVDVRWYETLNMARTDVDPSLVRPGQGNTTATNGGASVTNPNNVRGRYATHFHGTGPYVGRKLCVAEGVVCKGETGPALTAVPQPGWALVHHNSRVAVEKCITYNTRGAGIVSETGIEIGQWIGNTSAWNRGDGFANLGWGARAENFLNHNGHNGVAYENQARQILQRDNVASCSYTGWMFLQQPDQAKFRIPDQHSLRIKDPLCLGSGLNSAPIVGVNEGTYGIEQAQIPDFHNNIVLACDQGFAVGHREFTDRTENTPMIAKGFHCINVNTAYYLINYSFHYYFYDSLWIGRPGGDGHGARLGNVSWVQSVNNSHIVNFPVGIHDGGTGLNAGGFHVDVTFEDCGTNFTHAFSNWDTVAHPPEGCPLNGCMGPWTVLNSTTMRTRTNVSIDSATEVPILLPEAGMGPANKDPLPGTQKPYFYLDPSADITYPGLQLYGTIVDKLGARRWPFAYTSESFQWSHTAVVLKKAEGNSMHPARIVDRNGCFYDNGVLKSRLWVVDIERLAGEYFTFYIDIPITGLSAPEIAAALVDPWANAPVVPLAAEAIPATPAPASYSKPAYLRSLALSASSIPENTGAGTTVGGITRTHAGSTLSLVDSAGGKFALSGSDIQTAASATDFEVAPTHTIQVSETLAGSPNSGRVSSLTISVGDIAEMPTILTAAVIETTTVSEGDVITPKHSVWTNGPTSYTYDWTADGVSTGVTTLSYTASSGDLTKVLRRIDTAHAPGFTSSPSTSNATNPVLAAPTDYLLDNVVASAYTMVSMRKVDVDYAGPCIRVRRSSDDTEQDIGFITNGHLDTAALMTFVGSGDGFVRTWYDQSGNARNATQTTNSRQPKIVTAGVLYMVRGRPAIRFTGSPMSISGPTGRPLSIMSVANCESEGSTVYGGSSSFGPSFQYMFYPSEFSSRLSQFNGTKLAGLLQSAVPDDKYNIVVMTTTTVYLEVSGVNTTATNSTSVTSQLACIGSITPSHTGSSSLTGPIQEFVVFNTAIDTTDVTTLRDSINAYYSM